MWASGEPVGPRHAASLLMEFFAQRQPTFGDPALGPGAQGFERLVLIDLVHVSRSSWQPILGVIN